MSNDDNDKRTSNRGEMKEGKRIIKKTALSLMSYLNKIPNVDIQYV